MNLKSKLMGMDTALIDKGAMISMMSQEYCEDHGYEIQPLDQLVPIEGSGGRHSLFRLCGCQNANSRDQLFQTRCSHAYELHNYLLSSMGTILSG